MTTAANFQIRLSRASGGAIDIIVDGARWAQAIPRSHGSKGTDYSLRDSRGRTVRAVSTDSNPHTAPMIRVANDTMVAKRPGGANHVPDFEKRLVAKVRELIDAGLLLSPSELEAAAVAEATKRQESYTAQAAQKTAAFEARAREAIRSVPTLDFKTATAGDLLVRAIVAAMEWAQTR